MDKQERDRLRELEKASGYSGRPVVRCVASKSGGFELLGSYYGAAGAQHARNEAEYINACVYSNRALLDHIDALEGKIEALKAHEMNFCMKHGGYGQASDCASCKEIARAENKPGEPEVEMRMGSPVYGPGCSCVEEINPLDEILNSRKAKAALTQAEEKGNG